MSTSPQISRLAFIEGYLSRPRNPQFPKIAEFLHDAGELDAAIWVLNQGLIDFPVMSSAKLQLARTLYLRGLVEDAGDQLASLEATQPKNISLLKLKLRLAVLLDHKDLALVTLKFLSEMVPDDELMRRCRLGTAMDEFSSVKRSLANESVFLANRIRGLPIQPLVGSWETAMDVLRNISQIKTNNPTELNNFDAFVPIPTASAVKLSATFKPSAQLKFLTRLLAGLEKLG